MKRVKSVVVLVSIMSLVFSQVGWAEEKEKEVTKLEEIVVTAPPTEAVPPAARVPAVVESITKEDFEKRNVVGTDDILRYQPGLHVRKLIPGSSSNLSIRGTHNQTSGRTLVLADEMRLSNYLSVAAGPKWSLVALEEIERVDVIYGPYSALYSGNAFGGVVFITTRLPEKREISANTSYMYHNFKAYKSDYDLDGYTTHLSYGDKFGKFRIFGLFDRLENESQPISFFAKLKKDGAAPVGNPV
ncbi:MAG: TonB-dependent receptor plug domain-containing protein, partial [Syntrophales bacterium]|nr:TonB-dependent receptor plug domain-containing protein [Syntrophales bacterium]